MFHRTRAPAFIMAILLVAVLSFAACSSKVSQIVNRSKVTYDLITDTVIDLDKAGLIDKADYERIEKYADRYADLHNAAIEAIKAYQRSEITGDAVNDKIVAISEALTELLKAAGPYIVKDGG